MSDIFFASWFWTSSYLTRPSHLPTCLPPRILSEASFSLRSLGQLYHLLIVLSLLVSFSSFTERGSFVRASPLFLNVFLFFPLASLCSSVLSYFWPVSVRACRPPLLDSFTRRNFPLLAISASSFLSSMVKHPTSLVCLRYYLLDSNSFSCSSSPVSKLSSSSTEKPKILSMLSRYSWCTIAIFSILSHVLVLARILSD